MRQENCFAFIDEKCAALNRADCNFCDFFKTAARQRLEAEKGRERHKRLSREQQIYIQMKYGMREEQAWG